MGTTARRDGSDGTEQIGRKAGGSSEDRARTVPRGRRGGRVVRAGLVAKWRSRITAEIGATASFLGLSGDKPDSKSSRDRAGHPGLGGGRREGGVEGARRDERQFTLSPPKSALRDATARPGRIEDRSPSRTGHR